MSKAIIKTKHLSAGYNGNSILEDISIEIFEHEITVILGVSGCGKTTLLKTLIGLLKPTRGYIEILGREMINIEEDEYNELMKNIGVLFQGGALLNSIPLSHNVAIPLEQHTNIPAHLIDRIVRLKLSLVGLGHAYDYLPSQLSGGMRKRAALARAIALDPAILFADEPTAGLDPVTASSLDNLLLSLREQLGMTLVIVTHELSSIRRVADKIIYLDKGRVLFSGKLQSAMDSDIPELQNFFTAQNIT